MNPYHAKKISFPRDEQLARATEARDFAKQGFPELIIQRKAELERETDPQIRQFLRGYIMKLERQLERQLRETTDYINRQK